MHPAVRGWFEGRFSAPTETQTGAWEAVRRGRDVLVSAPTGSGKTLAAFLVAIDELVRMADQDALRDETLVVYVSPLRALSNDIEKNLEEPLRGIAEHFEARTGRPLEIRSAVRTGDTTAKERARAGKRPPHIYVTTPESLYILLTSEGGRALLSTTRTVIVDEVHALAPDKRGAHLALSLERLDALLQRNGRARAQRVGLSATQKPIERIGAFVVGERGADRLPEIVDAGHMRDRDLEVIVPDSPLETVMSNEVWEELYDRITGLVETHRTTLVFVNTRRVAERMARHLAERLGRDAVTAHHGSLAKEHRLDAERRLKSGSLRALVATASLELGIDVGDVELVVQVGSTRRISTLLQRVGRSGHFLAGLPKGRVFPTTRDELVESVALVDAARRGELDAITIPECPLDILAQQIVAEVAAAGEASLDDLFELVRGAASYSTLGRRSFDAVVDMLAKGFATHRGRRGAYVHHDPVGRVLRPRRSARLAAITSGGAIADLADYDVVLEPAATRIGSLNEDFAIESMAGDIFQLGNASYRILKVEAGRVRVEDACGLPPTLPFWLGEAPSRSDELSHALSRLRQKLADELTRDPSGDGASRYLLNEVGVQPDVASELVTYAKVTLETLGAMPTQNRLVLERFFDETGGMHLIVHAPFGSRVNRAFGLALRKSFCRKFDFELQAAAGEDALVLSLGPTHAFALEEVWGLMKSKTARSVLVQAILAAPFFTARWRWNAQRSLAVLRFRGGKKVPPRFQRMDADDLLTVCFPSQVACLENVVGDREIPDHPLVEQTIADCLHEATDADAFVALLERIERGDIELVTRDLTEPSPLAGSILSARPYAFLDDAPLEERRTQAVMSRRWLDSADVRDLAALDPAAIEAVVREAWPDPRDADELADALSVLGYLTDEEGVSAGLTPFFDALCASRRATRVEHGSGPALWVGVDRAVECRSVHPRARFQPELDHAGERAARDEAIFSLVGSRLEAIGPTTARELSASLGVGVSDVRIALGRIESEGRILRGSFRPAASRSEPGEEEICDKRLLARIHRKTIGRLRAEIKPVSTADYLRFLFRHGRVHPECRGKGEGGVLLAIELLEGVAAPAGAWEPDLLSSRVEGYDPAWLDALSMRGKIAWLRRRTSEARAISLRTSPISIVERASLPTWLSLRSEVDDGARLASGAERLLAQMRECGPAFFDELVRASGMLKAQVEDALSELAASGLVASDGFGGIRGLIGVRQKRPAHRQGRAYGHGLDAAGRWAALPESAPPTDDDIEHVARVLLRRWGVVFRLLLDREPGLPRWRDLLRVLRRLEARGEVRGGRFVEGVSGEQYALPEAIAPLREARRRGPDGSIVRLSATDPLNLVGVLLHRRDGLVGDDALLGQRAVRVSRVASNHVVFRDAAPIAALEARGVRWLVSEDDSKDERVRAALRRKVAPSIRAYLGARA